MHAGIVFRKISSSQANEQLVASASGAISSGPPLPRRERMSAKSSSLMIMCHYLNIIYGCLPAVNFVTFKDKCYHTGSFPLDHRWKSLMWLWLFHQWIVIVIDASFYLFIFLVLAPKPSGGAIGSTAYMAYSTKSSGTLESFSSVNVTLSTSRGNSEKLQVKGVLRENVREDLN